MSIFRFLIKSLEKTENNKMLKCSILKKENEY